MGYIYFPWYELAWTLTFLVVGGIGLNYICARLIQVPFTPESSYVTALILFCILEPVNSVAGLIPLSIALGVAILSKYVLVYRSTHIFNPAAIGALSVGLLGYGTAFWWIGTPFMFVFTVILGLLVVRKTRLFAMAVTATSASLVTVSLSSLYMNMDVGATLLSALISGPLIFFVTIMLTEPHTIAATRRQQLVYGVFIGFASSVFGFIPAGMHFATSPELALCIANVASFIVAHRSRIILTLVETKQVAKDTYEYVCAPDRPISFTAGQYMEWLLPLGITDDRGGRRYFTIASSPTDSHISFTTKFPQTDESAFKQKLKTLKIGDVFSATQLRGDFIMPTDTTIPLVWIAGGIGVTPFISQMRYLVQKGETRNVVLFYCARTSLDVAYHDEIAEANKVGVRVVYVLNAQESPTDMLHEKGVLTAELLQKYAPPSSNTQYFISGPNSMVDALYAVLHASGVSRKKIHTDFFPGF
jgi:ferredoxin-NADP reductase/Na+-translocating ferredoxin:NAD+ oxidoreductase RnfD subunit